MKTVREILLFTCALSASGAAIPQLALAQDVKPASSEAHANPESRDTKDASYEIRTFTLVNAVDQNDFNDIQTALRQVLPRARIYAVPFNKKLVLGASQSDLTAAQEVITELDHPRKAYRVTYTFTDSDDGKRIGTQHFALVIVAGNKTDLKQGSKVPIVTGSYNTASTPHDAETQVQYLDIGLQIEAQLESVEGGVKLRSQVVQSALGEQPSDFNKQDPVIRQTSLEGTASLTPGKPLILGSIDIPGTTRHQDVEVVAEQIK